MSLSWLSLGLAALLGLQEPVPQRAGSAPAPSPPPARTLLEGRVLDAAGRPVAEARVLVRARLSGGNLQAATSDAQGRFRFELSRACPCALQVEAEGWATLTLRGVREGQALALRLARGHTIEGVVRDGERGQPVPGAQVEARSWRALTDPWDPDVGRRRTVADADGRFRLTGLTAGEHELLARARGYAVSQRMVRASGHTEVFLFPGGAVVGRVGEASGKPVSGALVSLVPAGPEATASGATRADADGAFALLGIDPGSYRLVARHEQKAPALSGELNITAGSELELDVVLHEGTTARGRLVDPEQRPLPGRVVLLELEGQPVPSALAALFEARAEGDGRFVLGALPPGVHVVEATAPGYEATRVSVEAREDEPDLGDIVLRAGLTIRGVVQDREGHGVGDAALFARARSGGWWGRERAGSDGSFVLTVPKQGDYELQASAPGHGAAHAAARAGSEGVSLVLAPAGTISGVAVDEDGRPLESFDVEVSGRGMSGQEQLGFASAGEDGRFTVEDIRVGECSLRIVAPDFAPAEVAKLEVRAGRVSDVGRVRVPRGGVVRGFVVDAAGAAIPAVSIEPEQRVRRLYFGRRSTVSDSSGSFELRGLVAGPMTLRARHPSYASGLSPEIEVRPGAEVETRIVLVRGGRVEGTVRGRSGRGLAGLLVLAFAERPGLLGGGDQTASGADGSFVLERVVPGPVRVAAMGASGQGYRSLVSREVEVTDGGTAQLELVVREVRLSGRVLRSGSAASGVRLKLTPLEFHAAFFGPNTPPATPGIERMGAETDAEGRYQLLVAEPGRFLLEIEGPSGPWPPREIEVPDVEAYVLDLDVPLRRVVGAVVDAESGRPLSEAQILASPKGEGAGRPTTLNVPADADGRFVLELEDGDWDVTARSPDHVRGSVELALGAAAPPELRLELARGGRLFGRVVDAQQRGVAGLRLSASAEGTLSLGAALTQGDGRFEVTGLLEQPHVVVASTESGQFAIAIANPGPDELVLTLRPGGRVELSVRKPDGGPVADAVAWVDRVDGLAVRRLGWSSSSSAGVATLVVPPGELVVSARKGGLSGESSVRVGEGETVGVELRLEEKEPPR